MILAVIGIVLISGCIQEEVEKRGKIIEPAATTQLTFLDLAGDPDWSPDGTKIARTRYRGENASIWVMNADGSGKTQLTTEEDGICVRHSFSYDGSKIVYIKGAIYGLPGRESGSNEIWVMDNDGSNKHQIFASTDGLSLIFQRAWNKDNKILFMYRGIQEYVVPRPSDWVINSDGSNPHPVVQNFSYICGDPVWSNDGTKVAITRIPMRGEGFAPDVFVFSWEE